jgi:hypothetical protein
LWPFRRKLAEPIGPRRKHLLQDEVAIPDIFGGMLLVGRKDHHPTRAEGCLVILAGEARFSFKHDGDLLLGMTVAAGKGVAREYGLP